MGEELSSTTTSMTTATSHLEPLHNHHPHQQQQQQQQPSSTPSRGAALPSGDTVVPRSASSDAILRRVKRVESNRSVAAASSFCDSGGGAVDAANIRVKDEASTSAVVGVDGLSVPVGKDVMATTPVTYREVAHSHRKSCMLTTKNACTDKHRQPHILWYAFTHKKSSILCWLDMYMKIPFRAWFCFAFIFFVFIETRV